MAWKVCFLRKFAELSSKRFSTAELTERGSTCNRLSFDVAKGSSPQQSRVEKQGYSREVVRGLPYLPSIPEVPVSPSGRREVLPKCKILLVMQAEQESEVCFDFPQRHRRESRSKVFPVGKNRLISTGTAGNRERRFYQSRNRVNLGRKIKPIPVRDISLVFLSPGE